MGYLRKALTLVMETIWHLPSCWTQALLKVRFRIGYATSYWLMLDRRCLLQPVLNATKSRIQIWCVDRYWHGRKVVFCGRRYFRNVLQSMFSAISLISVLSLLRRGLGDRVQLVSHLVPTIPSWDLETKIPVPSVWLWHTVLRPTYPSRVLPSDCSSIRPILRGLLIQAPPRI